MTITGSLSNALSGLTAQARAAQVVSSNVANANTDGYARRELDLTPRYTGDGSPAGVKVVGVRREVDMVVVQDRRLADATVGYDETISQFYTQVERIIGTPDQEGSLSARVDNLETALIAAASRPDNDSRLSGVLSAATDITTQLNDSSRKIQELRMAADQQISVQVSHLNTGLQRVEELNYQIKEMVARGQDSSTLLDMRQVAVDSISSIVPLKQLPRENGMIALYTTGGAILLDGRAAEVEFQSVGVIVPEMTIDSGGLKGLEINGNDVRVSGDNSPIKGGSLAGLFAVRDEISTNVQSQLDAFVRDLIERFQDSNVDDTRAVGDAGLFTDAGAAFDPLDETGISSRISINSAVVPSEGGEIWRIRDGLGALVPGEVGESGLLQELSSALTDSRVALSGDFLGTGRSSSGLAGDLLSLVHTASLNSDSALSFSVSQQQTLKTQELSDGVDTDQELQKLLLIEQAYAANAKVIQTVGGLIDRLMEL
ncbi:MAG: flagellar hook-associated protein FlgK [Maritimibacter sp.]